MKRFFVAACVLVAVVMVVPVWGAPENYRIPPLQGGDTITVSCTGERLDATAVDATHQTLTCVADTTTTTTSTTTAPTTTTATTTSTTTTLAPTTTVPTTTTSGGTFTDGFANLGSWTFAHMGYEIPPRADSRSTATVASGRARIEAFDQNYGDATLRSAVKYDLTAGGAVTLDMTDDSGGNPLVGFANVSFSANPDDAKASMADERTDAYSPANLPADALQIQLRDNCRVPWAPPVAVRYRTNLPGGRTTYRASGCGATPDGRWRFVFTANSVSIRNGAGAEIVTYAAAVPPTGWVILGVHNHASMKYENKPSVVGLFDNVTYPR
jgi:hypothetical protein